MKIETALSLTDEDLESTFEKSAPELRTELRNRYANGERFILPEDCDNYDQVKGCLGHE